MSSLSFAGHRVVGGGDSSSCLRTHSIHGISTSLCKGRVRARSVGARLSDQLALG
jgi:hypothetical protein